LGSQLAVAQVDLNKPVGTFKGMDLKPEAPAAGNPGNNLSLGFGKIGPQQGTGAFPENPSNLSQQVPQQAPGVILTIPTK
jgi:hypothetical protein